MNKCFLCSESIYYELTLKQVFSLEELNFPIVCSDCYQKFEKPKEAEINCFSCKRALSKTSSSDWLKVYEKDNDTYCYDCFRWLEIYPKKYLKHDVVLEYNRTLQEYFYQYKYRADYRLARVVSNFLKEAYKKYKAYTWVVLPSSKKSLEERGFHATASLLEEAGISYINPMIYKASGKRQAQKTREERLKQEQPFELVEELKKGKYLIFDDVYTTGATVLNAKKCLFESENVTELISLSLGRDSLSE